VERIRVLIAEDERAVLDALTDLVSSDPAMEVVGSAADADEAIALADSARPDVALVDVRMPGGGGVRATREILERSPQTHVVALSAYEDRKTVLEMLRAGVVGYMVKGTPAEEILSTIRRSMRGQGNLSVEVTADVIHELTELLKRSEALAGELEELNRTKSEAARALIAVLENALDLSGEEPVELRIRRRGQEVEFAILDRGPGLPEELRRGIFDPFVQGDPSTTRSHEGLGIGLYLAQRIMTAHGGRIDAGAREGGGSVFRLSLPTFDPGPPEA